jgi:hypothetical protein
VIGSEVVAAYVDPILAATAAVTAAVADRRVPFDIVPAFLQLPACLYHKAGGGQYGGAIGVSPSAETLDFAVRFACDGASTAPIRAAAAAALTALGETNPTGDVTWDGTVYHVALTPTSEWPGPTTMFEDGRLYRILGTVYYAEVTIGG